MKQLSALKLKDLVSTQLDLSEMGNLIGGIEGDIMLLAYGCESEVCRNNQPGSEENVQLIRVIHLHVKVVHKPY